MMNAEHAKGMEKARAMMEDVKNMADAACKMMDKMMGKEHKEDIPKKNNTKGHYGM